MLGNFKHLFNAQPQTYAKIPLGILEALKYDLPKGFSYSDVGNGMCILNIPAGAKVQGRLRIEGSSFENMSKCRTWEDLIKYATNLQQPIIMEAGEDGYFLIDGNPIASNQIVQSPLKDFNLVEGSLRCLPKKMNQEFDMPMDLGGDSVIVHMKRVPYDSVEWYKFTGESEIGFSVSILAKESEPIIKINVTTDLKRSKTVQNAINSMNWYNCFANGDVKLFGKEAGLSNHGELTPYDNETLNFWKQVLYIEKHFGVAFDVSLPVYAKDVVKIRELYRSLVERKPFRLDESITKLNGNGDFNTAQEIHNLEGKELYFRFLKDEKTDILGVELQLWAIKYVFGTKIKKLFFNKETSDYEVILEQAGDAIVPYTATLYFAKEEELSAFLEKEDSKCDDFLHAEIINTMDLISSN